MVQSDRQPFCHSPGGVLYRALTLNLMQAQEVVFIGYSLPDADYHFRTLLRRAVNPNARIVVVLSNSDNTRKRTPLNTHRFYAKSRYEEFFGQDRIEFEFGGVEAFFKKSVRASGPANLVRRLKRKLATTL